VKAIGEATTPPPAAIANALFDATDFRTTELLISAERVFAALHS
jgi:CO/xanthine dehydrogenase Mo-binding subunit